MFEGIILGTIQGITEWLPISSEGFIVLAETRFFGGADLSSMIRLALFLHLGTLFAALVYFRRDIADLFRVFLHYKNARDGEKRILVFLIVATFVSGMVGFLLFQLINQYEELFLVSGQTITVLIGVSLLLTAYFIFHGRKSVPDETREPRRTDGVILGVLQGLAVLPGISRSGITVSALLLLGFPEVKALRLSFLLSIPIVFAGNVLLNLASFQISMVGAAGLIFSFVSGLATIHYFLKLAEKVNFGYFALGFGILMISSVFI